jgi:hypothetical protein
MNNAFIVEVRKLANDLPPKNGDIEALDQLKCDLVLKTEQTITDNENIGKRMLQHTIDELKNEQQFILSKIKNYLRELDAQGLDDYNSSYSMSKDVVFMLEDAIFDLEKLWKIYYADPDSKNPDKDQPPVTKIYNINKIDNANFS